MASTLTSYLPALGRTGLCCTVAEGCDGTLVCLTSCIMGRPLLGRRPTLTRHGFCLDSGEAAVCPLCTLPTPKGNLRVIKRLLSLLIRRSLSRLERMNFIPRRHQVLLYIAYCFFSPLFSPFPQPQLVPLRAQSRISPSAFHKRLLSAYPNSGFLEDYMGIFMPPCTALSSPGYASVCLNSKG